MSTSLGFDGKDLSVHMYSCSRIFCFLFHIEDLAENIEEYHVKTYSLLLPICTVVAAINVLGKYCGRVFGRD